MANLGYMRNRINNLYLLAHCFLWSLWCGSATRTPKMPPKTVLVVQLAWLGDMVCTTPVFRAIKKKYPDCRVIVVGMERNEKLLANHPDVDRYIVWKEDFRYIKNLLKAEKIDFALSVTPNFLVLAYLYLLGIPAIAVPEIKAGWSPYETISFRILRSLAIKIPHTMGTYAPREYLRLLEPIGIFSDITTKKLNFSDTARQKVDKILSSAVVSKESIWVAISPSSGNKIKNWPADRFAQVADFLIEKYNATIFLIGSKSDQEEVGKMLSSTKYADRMINTLGELSLDELKYFMSRMDLFIAVDTGPIYIAEAFGVPTVDIVGAMDENEQPPRGEIHRIVVDPHRKSPELHIMNARVYNKEEARRQTEQIASEEVIAIATELIEHLNIKK